MSFLHFFGVVFLLVCPQWSLSSDSDSRCVVALEKRSDSSAYVETGYSVSLKEYIAAILEPHVPLEIDQILKLINLPRNPDHGDYSFPAFPLAKTLRKNPALIAGELVQSIQSSNPRGLESVSSIGGFVNFRIKLDRIQKTLETQLGVDYGNLGHSKSGEGKRVVIDYGSPNAAKPMHVGHLRASVIGQALRNIAITQGYDVLGLNHLGDWGVQFGRLVWAYIHWSAEYPFDEDPYQSLFELYVRFHKEAEDRPQMYTEASELFRKLEEGDDDIEALWERIVDITNVENQKLWDVLGIRHDLTLGESFYNSQLRGVEGALLERGLLSESEGAQVVFFEGNQMPPALIRKSDGASLYATRDIASAIYRVDELGADEVIYVVGKDQTLHFKQVFRVLEMMGYDWASQLSHVSFGLYRFKDGNMSTRKGRVIFLKDLIEKAYEVTHRIIQERSPDLENLERVTKQVAVGALIFNDLVNDRSNDVEFSWERMLDFQGDSGPRVQYTAIQARSLLQRFTEVQSEGFRTLLDSHEERQLMLRLLAFQRTLEKAYQTFKPSVVAQYLLDLSKDFRSFYHVHRLSEVTDEGELASKLYLVRLTENVLRKGLAVLNIETPEEM